MSEILNRLQTNYVVYSKVFLQRLIEKLIIQVFFAGVSSPCKYRPISDRDEY